MKKILLLIIALLTVLSCIGCNYEIVTPDEVKTQYDEQGRIVVEGIPDRPGSYYKYVYDENGRRQKRLEYLTVDQEEPYSEAIYYYEGDTLTHTIGKSKDGTTEKALYHKNGNIKISTSYDADMKIIGVSEFNEQGEIIRIDLYRNGIIDKSQHYDPKCKNAEHYLVGADFYDDNGRLIKSSKTTFDEDGTSHNKTYLYDEETGRMYMARYLVVKNEDIILEERYDVNGQPIN